MEADLKRPLLLLKVFGLGSTAPESKYRCVYQCYSIAVMLTQIAFLIRITSFIGLDNFESLTPGNALLFSTLSWFIQATLKSAHSIFRLHKHQGKTGEKFSEIFLEFAGIQESKSTLECQRAAKYISRTAFAFGIIYIAINQFVLVFQLVGITKLMLPVDFFGFHSLVYAFLFTNLFFSVSWVSR